MKKTKKDTDITEKKGKALPVLILVIVAVLALAAAVYIGTRKDQTPQNDDSNDKAQTEDGADDEYAVTYKGKKYKYNSNLKTMLFLGVDKNNEVEIQEIAGRSGQSDCLILLVLNEKEQTTTLLEISRDAMTDVKVYGINGDYMSTTKAQIATQYAYGDGEKRSCNLVVNAVSDLLYGIRIHDYLALNMAGIEPIVDGIGGVELTIPKDYTQYNEAFVQGATLNLTGAQAERYVRGRNLEEWDSNNDRMERQTQFIHALLEKVQGTEDGGNAMLKKFWSIGEPYITTDLELNMLEKMLSYSMEPEVYKVPGEVRAGEVHAEFYVDEEALQEMIIEIFYREIDS